MSKSGATAKSGTKSPSKPGPSTGKREHKAVTAQKSSNISPRIPESGEHSRHTRTPAPTGLHASDLRAQRHSQHWTIVIDETGAEFDANAAAVKPSRRGRFVAIAIPSKTNLPPLPAGWHAVDQNRSNPQSIDRVLQNVLDADVGIFGIKVESLPTTPGERWVDGVVFLIDWVLRLLPVEGPTRLRVLVENRGDFRRGDLWPLVERDCLRRLALVFPRIAGWIDLHIEVIGKSDSKFNGYADAVAYTWAQTSLASKIRMKESQLANTCLLESDARTLLNAWDSFAQGVRLPGPDWWNLLPQSANPASLTATLLDHIGTECQADSSRWSVYLDETRRQMAGGAVELARLADATAWLDRFLPENACVPPHMRLAWLIVKLARSNHYGDAESAWEQEVASLAPTLIDEAAPMVCHADLHLAVARTNRFDFEGASRALDRWRDLPIQIPGLRYWAQVRSSLGQHAAFQGDQSAAVALFDEAIAAFGRLSDPAVRDKEASQTGAYRAIALMDQPDAPDDLVREAVGKITGPINKAIPRLATSGLPAKRYAHHLLLRWLVLRGQPEQRDAYLKHRAEWQAGHGHPWPLIQIYRAILLHPNDATAAKQLALDAADLAFSADQGPVVRLIGACCRTIAAGWGEPWPEAAAEFKELEATLPAAQDRIATLRAAQENQMPPLDLLTKVLPFNFR